MHESDKELLPKMKKSRKKKTFQAGGRHKQPGNCAKEKKDKHVRQGPNKLLFLWHETGKNPREPEPSLKRVLQHYSTPKFLFQAYVYWRSERLVQQEPHQ